MQLPRLRIGNLEPRYPIIQGGMAIRISLSELAAAVANEGGIGLIAASGLPLDELRAEIRNARKLSKGIIGVNIMYAAMEFKELVQTSIEEKIDLIVTGAGFSREIYGWGKDSGTPIVPIVSTPKLAAIAEKLGAAAIVVEGFEAGGHLGTLESSWKIVPEVKSAVSIPVIGAGGVFDGEQLYRMLEISDGVQMATRFAASKESAAAQEWKELYLKAQEGDVVVISSPVGMKGHALKDTRFTEQILRKETKAIVGCQQCLKKCSREYCIIDALINAQQGRIHEGVVFAGSNAYRVNEIKTVKQIFSELLSEFEEALAGRGEKVLAKFHVGDRRI